MLPKKLNFFTSLLAFVLSSQAFAISVSDDFTQVVDTNNWVAEAYACLTAGTSTNNTSATSKIPGCNYGSPDAAGSGALRLTPASNNQHGAIVSNYTFPSTQGLQVTFTTYTYGGSANGLANDGADGISFFLMDGSVPTTLPDGSTNLGSWGGSLAYSCSNTNPPYVGLTGAYLGLGMDEWGNFLNSPDNTATGIPIQTTDNGYGFNSFTSGSYMQANRIGLRGAGNVSWWWLNNHYPWYYPSTLSSSAQQTAVQKTCQTGTLWNNASSSAKNITGLSNSGRTLTVTVPNHGFLSGDTVVLGGSITDVATAKAITAASSSGTTLTVTVPNHGFLNGDNVTLGGTITGTAPAKTITNLSASGTTLTVTVPSHGFVNGDSVIIGGNITDVASAKTITGLSVSGTTLTVTINSHGFSVGDQVTLGGTIAATGPTQGITSIANYVAGPPKTAQITVPSAAGYSVGDSIVISGVTGSNAARLNGTRTITAKSGNVLTITVGGSTSSNITLTSATIYNSTTTPTIPGSYTITGKTPNTFTVTLASAAGTVTNTSGTATDTSQTLPTIPGTYTISGVTGNTFAITLSGTPGTITNNSGTATDPARAPTLTGSYTISGVTANTFNVTLASAPGTVTNTSGTAALTSVPAIPATYTITGVPDTNTFTVTLTGTPGTITNVSGTAADSSNGSGPRNTNTTVAQLDYAVIPGGFFVLPSSQKIADESHSVRSAAWPITYRLQITPAGLLTFMYSYNGAAYRTVITNWPLTTANGPLPATFRFGFAGSTGGATNVHEITCFVAEPTQSSSSAAANTVQAGQVRIGTQEYLASYDPNNWSASLVSKALVNTNGVISVSNVADWDADCVLTGGGCTSMGTDASGTPLHTITVESPSDRNLLTWDGSHGISLQWSSLTTAQKATLNTSVLGTTDTNGSIRLDWLRGGRSNEQGASPAGPLRIRSDVLGDIINSSPTWVGPPQMLYQASFTDNLYGAGSESSYAQFKSDNATRMNVVYVGSNDGLVHGFRTGANNADGTYNSTDNDGKELIGYMPSTVLANANVVSLTDPTYGHNYFVDAPPATGDLYYNNAWHTWLVGSLGAGGAEIYALDITDPTQFSENHASTLVRGDWTSSTLSNLGKSSGMPLIRRLHNGNWAIIFGNGLGSSNYLGGVYIGLVDSSTGAVTYMWLSTGAGTSSTPNGVVSVESADLDSDHVVDYLYAGDLLGNIWRFDLTSSNPSDWGVSKFGQPTATPLFVAKDSSGTRQPITTKVLAVAALTGGTNRVMVSFGTGKAVPATTTVPITYASGAQTMYGIWDWDMHAWNHGTTTSNSVVIPASTTIYAELSETTTSPYRTFARADLAVDTASASGGYATTAKSTVCWQGSSTCTPASANTKYGWLFDLPTTGEQIIYNPAFSGGEVFVNTTIPPTTSLGQCSPTLPTGWTRAFNIASGGAPDVNPTPQNVFPDASGSVVASGNAITAIRQDGVGTPWFVSIGSQQYIITQTVTGNATVGQINPQGGVTAKRVTWEQLR